MKCYKCRREKQVGIYRRIKGEEQWWCINCVRSIAWRYTDETPIILSKKRGKSNGFSIRRLF